MRPPLPLSLVFTILVILITYAEGVVVYQVRFIATKNGRTDYALVGESIELSCHYMMKDEAEDVKQLVWSKDGKNFLKWRKNKPGLEVLSYTFKGHIDPTSKHSHVIIHNVTIDMHGKYKCSVRTDLGAREMERELVVISQSSCKLNDWLITSQANECRETIKFDCKNMFPKPVPSCGLWNSKLEKFIRSVMVDISEEPSKQTYRIRYNDKFELAHQQQTMASNSSDNGGSLLNDELLQFAGHLMFKCDIIVPETSWKLSLIHRMFDYNDGCLNDPLDTIERMRLNYSRQAAIRMQQAGSIATKQFDDFEMLTSNLKYELAPPVSGKLELNCWRKPRLGSLARLSCANKANQVKLIGTNLLECQPEGWVPILQNHKKLSRNRKPPRPSRRATNQSNTGQREPEESSPESKSRLGDGTNSSSMELSNSELPDTNNDLEDTFPSLSPSQPSELSLLEAELIPTNSRVLSNLELRPTEPVRRSVLTPYQLATLLPTCVSNRRAHYSSEIVGIGMNMPDEARILESSQSIGSRNKQLRTNNQDKPQQNSFFNFSSSGSIETLKIKLNKQLVIIVITLGTIMGLQILYTQQLRFSI